LTNRENCEKLGLDVPAIDAEYKENASGKKKKVEGDELLIEDALNE
jgi:hypothetical protein